MESPDAEAALPARPPDEALLPTSNRLLLAAGAGYVDKVKLFLGRRDESLSDELGNTALHHAAWYNHKEVVDFLLSRILSRDINAQNNDGSTALHFAVARGRSHKAVIEALVQFGASMDVRNANGMTARDIVLHHPEWVNFRHIRVLFGLGGAQSLNSAYGAVQPSPWARKNSSLGVLDGESMPLPGLMHDEAAADIEAVFRSLAGGRRRNAPHGGGPSAQSTLTEDDLVPLFDFLGLEVTKAEREEVLWLIDRNSDGLVDAADFSKTMLSRDTSQWHPTFSSKLPYEALARTHGRCICAEDLQTARRLLGPLSQLESDAEVGILVRLFEDERKRLEEMEEENAAASRAAMAATPASAPVPTPATGTATAGAAGIAAASAVPATAAGGGGGGVGGAKARQEAGVDAKTFDQIARGALDIRSAIRRFEASMESDMDWTARRGHARRSSNARASHHRRK